MNFQKYGIVYLMLALVAGVFVLTRMFPNFKVTDLNSVQFGASPSAQLTPIPKVNAKVIINFGSEQKTYENISAPTPYLALIEAVKKDNIEVSIKQYDFGILVEKIGQTANTTNQAWVYYVNGQAADAAADKKQLNAGDQVEWRYAKAQ